MSQKPKVNARRVGHNLERKIVKDLKKLGYNNALTARNASKLLDDCKVDIANVPFNIQAKRYLGRNVPYLSVFKQMRELLAKHFPERLNLPFFIVHKRAHGKDGTFVVMPLQDFYRLLKH